MRLFRTVTPLLAAVALAGPFTSATPSARPAGATVTARNTLDIPRSGETITLRAADIRPATGADDLGTIHVRQGAAGTEVLSQTVDLNDDGTFDELVFQADFDAGQSRTFTWPLVTATSTAGPISGLRAVRARAA